MTKQIVIILIVLISVIFYTVSSVKSKSKSVKQGSKPEESNKKSSTQIAMIMLNESSEIDTSRLQKELKSLFDHDVSIDNSAAKEKTIVFSSQGVHFGITEMQIPIPKQDLEFPIGTAWYWDNAAEAVVL